MVMKLTLPLKRIHFIGIGGIGMSALAEILMDLGYHVQGSDAKAGDNTNRLERKGIKVYIGHNVHNLKRADAVIMSAAIKSDNVEYRAAKKLKLPIGHRQEILAEILRYKQGICVAGTHGKTTTSSLIASVLKDAGLRPSFLIGGILNAFKTNSMHGSGKHMVVEACESDGFFLKFPTYASVVTNIDPEHMEYYKTFDVLKKTFETFIQNTDFYGFSVLCIDHPVVKEIAGRIKNRKIITYGLDPSADVYATNILPRDGYIKFDVHVCGDKKIRKIETVKLNMFGVHNVRNALACIAVAIECGVKDGIIKKALGKFAGVQKRLTLRGETDGIRIYDDYGHHPEEVKATLDAVSVARKGRVIALFEPHKYTRLHDLWEDFLRAFNKADTVIVAPLFTAGEEKISGVSHETFAAELRKIHKNVVCLKNWDEAPVVVGEQTDRGDIVVCLGAGLSSAKSKELAKQLKKVKK